MSKTEKKFKKLSDSGELPRKICSCCDGTTVTTCNNCLGIIDEDENECVECKNTGVVTCKQCEGIGTEDMDLDDFESRLEDFEEEDYE